MSADALLIARHGEAHNVVTGSIATHTCTGLTARGSEQAQQLAHTLRAHHTTAPISAVWSSPITRSQETAHIIADTFMLPVQVCDDLRPPDPGSLTGITWEDARRRFSPDPDNPDRPLAADTEPWKNYLTRITGALEKLITRTHTGTSALVVGHSETVTASYAYFLGSCQLQRVKYTVDLAGLTCWKRVTERPNVTPQQQRWTLTFHNHTVNRKSDGSPWGARTDREHEIPTGKNRTERHVRGGENSSNNRR